MQEIASNIFIETQYPGVVLGAILSDQGVIQVDAPLRIEDLRLWRAQLFEVGGNIETMMINLDTHIDRTIGMKNLEGILVAHHHAMNILKNRPASPRSQDFDTGSDWEDFDSFSSIRWVIPEITFTDRLALEWGDKKINLSYRRGAHSSGIWVEIPDSKVVFVGDTVVVNQPPFLGRADLSTWLEELTALSSPAFHGYQIVSGRNGLVKQDQISKFMDFLMTVQSYFDLPDPRTLKENDMREFSGQLIKKFTCPAELRDQFQKRLEWGLISYHEQHFSAKAKDIKE